MDLELGKGNDTYRKHDGQEVLFINPLAVPAGAPPLPISEVAVVGWDILRKFGLVTLGRHAGRAAVHVRRRPA